MELKNLLKGIENIKTKGDLGLEIKKVENNSKSNTRNIICCG